MDFTLEPADAQWVQEWITKSVEELKQTTPNGRQFADTVSTILDREKNWIKWKNELCAPFDKEPWSQEINGEKVGLWEATQTARADMLKPPGPWIYPLGSKPLSDVWDKGYTDLSNLSEQPFRPGDVRYFVNLMRQTDFKISKRRKQLNEELAQWQKGQDEAMETQETEPARGDADGQTAPSTPLTTAKSLSASGSLSLHPSLPPKPGSPVKSPETAKPSLSGALLLGDEEHVSEERPKPKSLDEDEELLELYEQKKRIAWLALRPAREMHLQHFGKIGTGDIALLQQEIEAEKKKEAERVLKEESAATTEENGGLDEKMEG